MYTNLEDREAEHDDKDPRFTAVCLDENDKYLGTEQLTKQAIKDRLPTST